MLPACEILDEIGYYSLECWGGATFDACMRFLNEDPWERLRKLRKALPNNQAADAVPRHRTYWVTSTMPTTWWTFFVKKSIENGIDIIRIFDALNDPRNLKQAIDSTKKYGGTCEAAHELHRKPGSYRGLLRNLAVELQKMGADVICIKDMANLLLPYNAYTLVKRLRKDVTVPIHLHTHNTAGTGDMTLLKAIEAGVDIVDTALSPLGNGTCQPATEPMVATPARHRSRHRSGSGSDERGRKALPRRG